MIIVIKLLGVKKNSIGSAPVYLAYENDDLLVNRI